MIKMIEYLDQSYDIAHEDFAAQYDELPFWSAPFGALLLARLPMQSIQTALDIGCGTGFPTIELAERLGQKSLVHCIDPWEVALNQLKRKISYRGIKNIVPVKGDAAQLPYEANTFDLVVSNLGINNFENPDRVLSECNRVLKKGGRLALTTNLVGHMQEFYEHYEQTLIELNLLDGLAALREHIAHRATVDKTVARMLKADFQIAQKYSDQFSMRFASGSAFLRHTFIKMGFLPAWKSIVTASDLPRVFELLETKLNRHADTRGELALTIPMAYIEAFK